MLTSLTAEKDRWIERDAQRTSRHSGQLSQTDWLNRQVELVFALQKAWTHDAGIKCVRLCRMWLSGTNIKFDEKNKSVNPSVVQCWQISWYVRMNYRDSQLNSFFLVHQVFDKENITKIPFLSLLSHLIRLINRIFSDGVKNTREGRKYNFKKSNCTELLFFLMLMLHVKQSQYESTYHQSF